MERKKIRKGKGCGKCKSQYLVEDIQKWCYSPVNKCQLKRRRKGLPPAPELAAAIWDCAITFLPDDTPPSGTPAEALCGVIKKVIDWVH
jgi:hypothetical protein